MNAEEVPEVTMRRAKFATACVWVAAAAGVMAAFWAWPHHRLSAAVMGIAAVMAAVAATAFRYRVSFGEQLIAQQQREMQRHRSRLAEQERQFRRRQQEWEATRQELVSQLQEEEQRIEKRRRQLAEQLLLFHEGREFPQPIDLQAASITAASGKDGQEVVACAEASADAGRLRDLAEKDRLVMELLEQEAGRLYESIRRNRFTVDGKFSWDRLWGELSEVILAVARVYQPHSQNPLLETSLEQLLRAGSRICLHLLVLMETLPFRVQQYNIQSIYTYVRKVTKAYGTYRHVQPYMNYGSYVWMAGRWIAGGNPIVLATWWLATEAGSRGLAKLTSNYVDRHAVEFVLNLVRVVGYEIAGIYGGDFRYRDANWVYGSELVEMVASFPLSREVLRPALQELTHLQLRNEYDRIYLLRCLALHQRPAGLRSASYLLTRPERQRIAQRLEQFFLEHVHGRGHDRLEAWRRDAEQRLGVRLQLRGGAGRPSRSGRASPRQPSATASAPDTSIRPSVSPTLAEKWQVIVRALYAFLIVAKQRSDRDALELIAHSRMTASLPPADRERMLAELEDDAPVTFELPDLAAEDPLVEAFVTTLIDWDVTLRPYTLLGDDLVQESATFFRLSDEKLQTLMHSSLSRWFAATRWAEALADYPPVDVLSVLRLHLAEDEVPVFAYANVTLQGSLLDGRSSEAKTTKKRWLIGTNKRLLLFASAPPIVELEWECGDDQPPEVQEVAGYVWSTYRLVGGNVMTSSVPETAVVEIPGSMWHRCDAYFAALQRWIEQATQGSAPEASEGSPTGA
ncbi:MAG: hypothetical protein KatS3mg111_0443 [Pirellulaceae bacterium]|nr:MAG: hypothetical protein KatS3mg111_0443 [Pirellulaceae bacterium]